ncbi:hypothetical protein ElyMa_001886400 [Elysia marginata]|uniref:Uncharacterized protein n=1 Tax=Elysia marginata TaxID=1093978 RepID=A0AAV4EQF4_9GAST|nr:hypothetical protein ElyMa_001886400 [Elysia marginata]
MEEGEGYDDDDDDDYDDDDDDDYDDDDDNDDDDDDDDVNNDDDCDDVLHEWLRHERGANDYNNGNVQSDDGDDWNDTIHSPETNSILWGSVAEWLARRTRDLDVAGSIPNHAMLRLPWESNLP